MALLHSAEGLRSFVAATIGPKARPMGALLLAKRAAGGFDNAR